MLTVIPAPPGFKFLRVWAAGHSPSTDSQPVLAFVFDSHSPTSPPEVVTPTGDSYSEESDEGFRGAGMMEAGRFRGAVVMEDGRAVSAEGAVYKSEFSFIDAVRADEARERVRAAKPAPKAPVPPVGSLTADDRRRADR